MNPLHTSQSKAILFKNIIAYGLYTLALYLILFFLNSIATTQTPYILSLLFGTLLAILYTATQFLPHKYLNIHLILTLLISITFLIIAHIYNNQIQITPYLQSISLPFLILLLIPIATAIIHYWLLQRHTQPTLQQQLRIRSLIGLLIVPILFFGNWVIILLCNYCFHSHLIHLISLILFNLLWLIYILYRSLSLPKKSIHPIFLLIFLLLTIYVSHFWSYRFFPNQFGHFITQSILISALFQILSLILMIHFQIQTLKQTHKQ